MYGKKPNSIAAGKVRLIGKMMKLRRTPRPSPLWSNRIPQYH
jgi:hypothetical protein